MILFRVFLFAFFSYACLATENIEEKTDQRYFCTYGRTVESSNELNNHRLEIEGFKEWSQFEIDQHQRAHLLAPLCTAESSHQ